MSIFAARSGVPILTAVLLLGFGSAASAALEWQAKTVSLKADAKTSVLEARYKFTNAGAQAVDVQQVESSCGCTTAALERRHYEVGESGEIVARYTVGGHVGHQSKTISVKSSDSVAPVILTLNVEIPEILRIRPAFVFWTVGEAKTPKSFTLEVMQDASLDDITVLTSNATMTAALQPLAKGRKYQLTVTPGQTDHFLFSALTINCRFGEEAKTFRAYATVKPALRTSE